MKILVTGATGFVGTTLCDLLIEKGHCIHYLTTSKSKLEDKESYKGFLWNPAKNTVDAQCLKGVACIVNLSGFTINSQWTTANKKQILESRLQSSETLFHLLNNNEHQVQYIVNASAIGIYESSETAVYDEDSQNFGNNFLANVCKKWETANLRFETLGIKTAVARFGLILSKDNGVLHELAKVVSKGLGANLGNGKQWMSWIHKKEVAAALLFLMEQRAEGLFNITAPNPVRQNQFLKLLAKQLRKPLWLPNVPAFALKMFLGEKAALVLSSQNVQLKNLESIGYKFLYPDLKTALADIYNKKRL